MHDSLLTRLRDHQTAIWINERQSTADPFDRQAAAEELAGAELLWQRFAPALAVLAQYLHDWGAAGLVRETLAPFRGRS